MFQFPLEASDVDDSLKFTPNFVVLAQERQHQCLISLSALEPIVTKARIDEFDHALVDPKSSLHAGW